MRSFIFADMIATMGEVTGQYALKYMHQKMINDPVGRLILEWVLYDTIQYEKSYTYFVESLETILQFYLQGRTTH